MNYSINLPKTSVVLNLSLRDLSKVLPSFMQNGTTVLSQGSVSHSVSMHLKRFHELYNSFVFYRNLLLSNAMQKKLEAFESSLKNT